MDTGFQPFADIDQTSELRWAVSWVCDICREQGLSITPSERNLIQDNLKTLASRPERSRNFSNFVEIMQGQSTEIAEALKPYSGSGDLGNLLNAREDYFKDDDLIVIELGSITELDQQIFTPVLTYLFHKVENLLSPDQPTHVVADEFFAFAKESKRGREYVETALRTFRKKNAFMTIATQTPGDLTGDETEGILSSINTFIMLPNPNALSPAQKKNYKKIGMNEQQIRLIADATPKKEYISVQPSGSRKFDLGLEPELAIMTEFEGYSLEQTAELIRDYKQRYGSTWIYEWYEARGMDDYSSDVPLDKKRGDGTGSLKYLPEPSGPVDPSGSFVPSDVHEPSSEDTTDSSPNQPSEHSSGEKSSDPTTTPAAP
jgi:type IV secretion system protein VirB4